MVICLACSAAAMEEFYFEFPCLEETVIDVSFAG